MNFPLEYLTSRTNINLFSTPKFKDTHFDKDSINKMDIYNFETILKNPSNCNITKQQIQNIDQPNNEINNLNNENTNKNNKDENQLRENFSLSSLGSINENNDITNLNKKNIIDIKINNNKKNESDDKCNIALISFCDKVENYSFNNDINCKEKSNNYSCSTNKDKQEMNNIIKPESTKTYKESEIKSNASSSGSIYNSSSFKYSLPLENDKIPLINGFMSYHNNNNDNIETNNINDNNNNINDNNNNNNNDNNKDNNTINDNNKNNNNNNGTKEDKSLELNDGHLENIDNNNNKIRKIQSIKDNLFIQYKNNNSNGNNNNNVDTSRRKVKKSETQKICRIIDKSFSFEKNDNNDSNDNIKNRTIIGKDTKNNHKNLVIKNNILLSGDNFKKNKKIMKVSSKSELKEKTRNENDNKNISPKKKFELILKQIDLNINENNLYVNNNSEENIKDLYSLTTREKKTLYNVPTELKADTHKNSKININSDNINNNNLPNTTNKIKSKIRKFIKSTPLEFSKAFFHSNNLKKNDKIKETSLLSKKLNSSCKNNYLNIQHNLVKTTEKNNKIIDNKKQSYHTRNISNLYSNKIFNGIKNLFKNSETNFNTISYEYKTINKKKLNKNALQSQLKNKPYIKNIIRKTSPLLNKTNSKKKNINEFYKKEIKKLIQLRSSIKYNSNNIDNNSIYLDKNKNDKKRNILQKKFKSNNYLKSNISSLNKFKKFLNNNNTTKNLLTLENKNMSTYRLSSSIFSGSNTDRNKDNNNYSSINVDNKSQINDSIFINVNESAINIDNSKYNKIKVNTINVNKKIQNLSQMSKNKTNSYYKIHKKPKNTCLINNYKKDINKIENNNLKIEPNYEKYIKGNSQILNFNKNKKTKLLELNNLKDNITQYNFSYNNSKSIISESSFTDKNNNNSINDIEKTKEQTKDQNNNNNLKKDYNQNYCKISDISKSQLNERPFISHKPDYKTNIQNFNEEIIKYSILRNNRNNQIINEFSVILGEEKNKSEIISENKKINNNLDDNPILSNENRRTIINVNQYYPRYYIDTHQICNNK